MKTTNGLFFLKKKSRTYKFENLNLKNCSNIKHISVTAKF